MNKNLYAGMEFENLHKLCDYIGWTFNGNHPDRIKKKLNSYISFHKEGKSKIVIDNVYSEISDMIQSQKKKDGTYIYNVNQVLNTTFGNIKIVAQVMIKTKKGTYRAGYKCKCLECGYEFEEYEYNLKNGIGCGCCAGKVVVKDINDLWTTAPEVACNLANPDDGYKYTKFSSKKVDFICPICGELLKNKTIRNIAVRGLPCYCQRTKSIPNRMMYWTLRNLNIHFNDEKDFKWSNQKRYDFYIPEFDLIIEMHGSYHYQEICFNDKTLEETQKNDLYKHDMAIDNGISNYIEIECKSSDFNYIKNHILQSDLYKFFDLDDIDWDYVKEKVYMSLIIEVAEKWNSGVREIDELAYHLGIKTTETVRKYINLARKYGYITQLDHVA